MSKTSLIIETQEMNETKKQMTITNVSASATDAQCYNFGAAIADLSTRTFLGIAKVTRTELTAPQEATNNGDGN